MPNTIHAVHGGEASTAHYKDHCMFSRPQLTHTLITDATSTRAESSRARREAREAKRFRSVVCVSDGYLTMGTTPPVPEDFIVLPSPFSSFASLPMDILVEVIREAHTQDPFIPITISQVNRRLRDSTITAPTIWSTIDIMHSKSVVELHLQRSDRAFLKVLMSLPSIYSVEDGARRLHDFISQLSPSAHRIQDLVSIQPHLEWGTICTSFTFAGNLTSLAHLDLGLGRDFYGTSSIQIDQSSEVAKSWPIKSLILKKCRLEGPIPAASGALTELRLDFVSHLSCRTLIRILGAAPSLRTVYVNHPFLPSHPSASYNPITLNQLENLTLAYIPTPYLNDFFTFVSTPSLQALTLQFRGRSVESSPNPLLTALTSNMCLRSLHIENWEMQAGDWIEVYDRLPMLSHLRIGSSGLTAANLMPLEGGDDDSETPRCPNLTSMVLENELSLKVDELVGILRSREERGMPRLREVAIQGYVCPEISSSSEAFMKDYIRHPSVDILQPGLAHKQCFGGIRGEEGDTQLDLEEAETRTNEEIVSDDDLGSESSSESGSEGSWMSGDDPVLLRSLVATVPNTTT